MDPLSVPMGYARNKAQEMRLILELAPGWGYMRVNTVKFDVHKKFFSYMHSSSIYPSF